MSPEIDILLKGAHVVDPVNHINDVKDIAVADGKVVAVSSAISPNSAKDVHHLEGYIAIPGIIDSHMHASSLTGGKYAFKMLAAAGVTTALEMAGPIESVWGIMSQNGAGLNIACLQAVAPGFSVDTPNPSLQELQKLYSDFVRKGALGFKILGGHFPLTPDSSALCIEVAQKNGGYCAFHAGTTESKSDIDGFFEAIELAAGNNLHLAHINSYCRGKNTSSLSEAVESLEALEKNPNIFSESYLSPMNGTSGKVVDNKPASNATAMWLEKYGFESSYAGMEAVIAKGVASVIAEEGGKMVLIDGPQAIKKWEDSQTDVLISFNINPADSRFLLAVGKRNSGRFCVDCISTDGGGIPRNVIVEKGLALVDFQALSMQEFVLKTSTNPANLLGLEKKGQLGPGADADITVIDKSKNKAFMSIAGGKTIMYAGHVIGKKGTALIYGEGEKYVKRSGLNTRLVDPSLFYKRPSY